VSLTEEHSFTPTVSLSSSRMSTSRSVAVAVSGGSGAAKGSRRALQWAMENVVPQADRLILVHVIPKITSIPTPGISTSYLLVKLFSYKP